ncbi:MAG TPA: hypothetical protein VIT23_06420, partial [Terrimicrobiaceae bacterium]
AQQTAHFPLTPSSHSTTGFWTDLKGIILHRLKNLEGFPALFTFVFVGWHRAQALSGIRRFVQ